MSYIASPVGADTAAHHSGTPGQPAPGRVVIVSAGVGAGHDGAADQLGRRLTALGGQVERWDFLDLLPAGTGRLLCSSYHRMLALVPSLYQRIHDTTGRTGRPGALQRALLGRAQTRLLHRLPSDTRAVVSTYPLASQTLGALRRSGRLSVPAITYLTDFSVHPLWVAPGVDVHLAAHPLPAAEATALGAAGTLVTGPLVDERFRPAAADARRAARARFGLPATGRLALLVAGSWGVGEVARVAAEVLRSGAALPVVVCGRNEALRRRLSAQGFRHVHGWVADMPELMQAADVLVQNAGGLTSLEAFASGLPVASYRCLPGHGRTNAAALDEAGLAVWIREPGQLAAVLAELPDGPRGRSQRAAGRALFASPGGPAHAVVRAAAPAPVPAAPWIPAPRDAQAPTHRTAPPGALTDLAQGGHR
ncbi:glycosyltransferase [Streptacidiphilus griseoplanus]|uniref:glycosyltransferase n=1 Tax=Peterkaempfera griseoplana TaxID=66896 RepID=UPI000AF399C9|nr:glycosyltransferase [Peterkaempfera griseoplana]